MLGFGSHRPRVRDDRGKLRSACSCGWEAIGRDSTHRSARQAWEAHLYAKGARTLAEVVSAAGLKSPRDLLSSTP